MASLFQIGEYFFPSVLEISILNCNILLTKKENKTVKWPSRLKKNTFRMRSWLSKPRGTFGERVQCGSPDP